VINLKKGGKSELVFNTNNFMANIIGSFYLAL
jgi:hypothetical protein